MRVKNLFHFTSKKENYIFYNYIFLFTRKEQFC